MKNQKLIELIKNMSHEFTNTDKDIADYILRHPEELAKMTTISNFSTASKFSVGSIVRFCKKLGFEGFSEFKFFVVNNLLAVELNDDDSYLDSLVNTYISEIKTMASNLDTESVSKLAKAILESNRVLILGKNSSYVAAQQLQLRLIRNGHTSLVVDDELTMFNYIDILDQNDVVVLFSVGGLASSEYKKIITDFQNSKIPLFLITLDDKSELYETAKQKVLLSNTLITKQHLALDGQLFFNLFTEILLHEMLLIKNY